MKFVKTIFVTAMTALVGVGVFTGAMNKSQKAEEPVAVEAAGVSFQRIYVNISNATSKYSNVYCHNWSNDGGSDYNGTTWPGTKMTRVGSTNFYYVDLKKHTFDDKYNNKCIFNNGSGTQTGNLDVNKYYELDSAGTGGEWSSSFDDYHVATSNPSSQTMRIFVNNSDLTNWSSNDAETRIRCWGGNTISSPYEGAIYDLKWFQNNGTGASGTWYGFADIPTNITGWAIVRCNPTYKRVIWNYGPTHESVSGAEAARIYKIKENGWNFYLDSNTGDSAVGPAFATTILQAYDTCSSSLLNGYNAYDSLNSNFFSKLTSAARTTSCASLNGTTKTVAEHVMGMSQRSIANSESAIGVLITNSNTSSAIPVVTTAVVALGAIGGFFFLKKKKISK